MNDMGWTPLHVALFNGHSDVAGIILRQDNVNLSLQTRVGTTAAMAAVIGGSLRCVEILAEQENYDSWNDNKYTPLISAIKKEKKEIIQVLLKCPRVNPNLKDEDGDSPLMKAIKEKKTAMARLLIQCPRVDLRTRDRNGASLQRIARWEETKINLNFDEVIDNFRESGLSDICDLLEDVKDARMGQLEMEKSDLSRSLLEKKPECPVNIKSFTLHFKQIPSMFYFLGLP